jgi:hypothetical protein
MPPGDASGLLSGLFCSIAIGEHTGLPTTMPPGYTSG